MAMAAWQKKMAAEIVAMDTGTILSTYADAAGFSVVNRESFKEILGEFELQGSEAFDEKETAKIGRMVGANYMLLISFSRSHIAGDRFRDVRTNKLIDMERNTILALDEIA